MCWWCASKSKLRCRILLVFFFNFLFKWIMNFRNKKSSFTTRQTKIKNYIFKFQTDISNFFVQCTLFWKTSIQEKRVSSFEYQNFVCKCILATNRSMQNNFYTVFFELWNFTKCDKSIGVFKGFRVVRFLKIDIFRNFFQAACESSVAKFLIYYKITLRKN